MLGMHDQRVPRPPRVAKGQGLTADMAIAYLKAHPQMGYRGKVLIQLALIRKLPSVMGEVIQAYYRVPAGPQEEPCYYRFMFCMDSDDIGTEELHWGIQWGMVPTQYPTLPTQ